MLFTARIKELEAELATVQGKLTAATGNIEALTAEKADLEAQLASAKEGMISQADHDAAILSKDTVIADLNKQIAASAENFETRVNDAVTERLAAAGAPPVKRDPAASSQTEPAPASGLSGMAKARAYFEGRQPAPKA